MKHASKGSQEMHGNIGGQAVTATREPAQAAVQALGGGASTDTTRPPGKTTKRGPDPRTRQYVDG